MPRIAGVSIPEDKRIETSLTYIYGIGHSLSSRILKTVNIDPNIRANKLSAQDLSKLKDVIEKSYRVEGELRRERLMNIKRLKDIHSYRGTRHMRGLPVRGQQTRTNTRTVRGNKRITMGSGRKPTAQKT